MLNKIPKILSPEIVKALMEMGHGDTLLLADANYPAQSCGENVLRADGLHIPQMLSAILELMPIDDYTEFPIQLMTPVKGDKKPKIWNEYKKSFDEKKINYLNRFDFYKASENCRLIIQTGETAIYANIFLTKGVIK
ncbi:RbsD/FucU family protein [Staphylococcus nepalensis]|uniref:Fucose isomerase n=1 Tax=Staphylococcus nepalensis TaxID=214473 RepID=A0ABS3L410_9STAP|nr:RbsD/FucU domain-containing protein [Staphylococcus nepalensis]MBO1206302.1 fucose isomerase [Staphylococcus nepalensis]MBO1212311.1 fucose isomerase [Staphylococcus nepalensis]MBO1217052.1 fucose isomerase [Staphylococcus nepalensis]MBO1227788.1 fucose isomerase [Staphylococcus nepalensis]MBO1235314.1 fucose isomerase [Staphylococcus nepalensis]